METKTAEVSVNSAGAGAVAGSSITASAASAATTAAAVVFANVAVVAIVATLAIVAIVAAGSRGRLESEVEVGNLNLSRVQQLES